jgi:hypothetical protein
MTTETQERKKVDTLRAALENLINSLCADDESIWSDRSISALEDAKKLLHENV